MKYRVERDSMGEVEVLSDRYWGAQTQRSTENFAIGDERMPLEMIVALASLKHACAEANCQLGKLSKEKRDIIVRVCGEILERKWDDHFPLKVWQTGSGTQSNMNINEVIANRGNEVAGRKLLHPNDDVNMSQSSNDIFPSAMHLAALDIIEEKLFSSISALIETFKRLEIENEGIVKLGRTHLQDATPIRFSQEISAWRAMLEKDMAMIDASLPNLREIAIGATAVGTGLNAPVGFGDRVAEILSDRRKKRFISAGNKFYALSSKNALVFAHGALKALAADLMKIANDVRWLAGGPRAGLFEITIPENEPGSSIMPGKVNPTQCEALSMVCCQVMANDVAVGLAASQGNFQLNVYMPVLIYNFLQSARLLSDSISSFHDNCAVGIKANADRMRDNVDGSFMLVTALAPRIGYDNAATVAKYAFDKNCTLKEATLHFGFLSAAEYDCLVVPEDMT